MGRRFQHVMTAVMYQAAAYEYYITYSIDTS